MAGIIGAVTKKITPIKPLEDETKGGIGPDGKPMAAPGVVAAGGVGGDPNQPSKPALSIGNATAPVALPPAGDAGAYGPGGTRMPAGTSVAQTIAGAQPPIQAAGTQGAWQPATGLDQQVKGIDASTVDATGYEAAAAPEARGAEAKGYDPLTYTADQTKENVSQAVDRIIGADSANMQRARAGATQTMNSRGLINSSMNAQAGEAAVLDAALPMAQGDVAAEQFNVAQRNDALKYSTEAKNQAAAYLANAKNIAEQFTSGEANKLAMFAVEQLNQASEFAAAAENAAATNNAQAFNEAKQRYADAVNAALAAQQEAENVSRRDAAQFAQQEKIEAMGNAAQIGAASIGAGATLGAARIRADSDAEARTWQSGENATAREENRTFTRETLGQQAYQRYVDRSAAIDAADLTPEARAAAHANNDAVSAGDPYWPVNITVPGGR